MRSASRVIIVSTLLAVPLTWLSLSAIYMPEPLASLARVVSFPLLLFDWLGPTDPTLMPAAGARWGMFIAGQLVWFWLMGFIALALWRLLRRVRRRNHLGSENQQ
jgi:Flp pilus assembly protein protease CpaA